MVVPPPSLVTPLAMWLRAGLGLFPTGIPFTFWEQYVNLRGFLLRGLLFALGKGGTHGVSAACVQWRRLTCHVVACLFRCRVHHHLCGVFGCR